MNTPDSLAPWLAPVGWLALESAVIVLATFAAQPLLRTAAARRSLWRAALLAMLAVLAAEFTGTGSQLPAQLRLAWQTTFPEPVPPPAPLPTTPARIELPPISHLPSAIPSEPPPEPLQSESIASLPPPPLSLSHSPTLPPAPTPWPALLWLTGLAVLLARAAWTHAGFAWLRLRHFLPAAEALRDRVQALAARLGLRRRVRVLASERLRAPAAFGWVRPGVAVPGDFTARFAPAQQDVMLAHELAHLAARDPLWQLLADLVTAALWWHPLAWVARHQHRHASELAADDASLALPDGPVTLAECLLALGHEATAAPPAVLGMAGFRSQLGRRIERLVSLPRRDWQAPGRLRLALQTTTALACLAALALLPGCAANRTASEAPAGLVTKWWQTKKTPPPVGDDVRSLQPNAERGVRNEELSHRLLTSSPTSAIDISVGRQLFVDDFLIASNTLTRTWHQPVVAPELPLVVIPAQAPLRGERPYCDQVWYDATNQLIRMRWAFANDTAEFNSTNGLAWPSTAVETCLPRVAHARPIRVQTEYESLHVALQKNAQPTWMGIWFGRTPLSFRWSTNYPVIPTPTFADGSLWTELHPLQGGFLVVGRQLHFYFGGRVQRAGEAHASAAVGLATLRRDGFASLDAGPEGGVVTTKPVTFTGRFMFVNFKTNAPDGELRIEILDADGNGIERFSRAKCIPLANDQTLIGVSWQNGVQSLAELAGKPVRFRFHLKNASLYSFWVGPGQLGRSLGRVAGGGPHFTNDVDTIGNRSYQPFPVKPLPPPKPGTLTVGDMLEVEVVHGAKGNHTLRSQVRVQSNGNVSLSGVAPVFIAGKTTEEARESIRQACLAAGLDNPMVSLTKADPLPSAPKPGASVPAPSPFAERGEKVAEGRLRGAVTNTVAAKRIVAVVNDTVIVEQRTDQPAIAPGDTLKLTVAEDDSFNAIYPVKRDGSITVAKLGLVRVNGMALTSAQAVVKTLLEAAQLPKATVTLEFVGARASAGEMSPTNSQRIIYLAGEFLTPGPLKLGEGESLTLTNVLLRSGGITPNGDLTRTKLLRIENGQGAVEEVNVAAILAGTRPATNGALLSGDIIMVPARPPVVFVTGKVGKPGAQSLGKYDKPTAYAAILRAGGFALGASLTNCYVVRDAGNGEKARLPFNVKEVQVGSAPDFDLQAGDIIVVPDGEPEAAKAAAQALASLRVRLEGIRQVEQQLKNPALTDSERLSLYASANTSPLRFNPPALRLTNGAFVVRSAQGATGVESWEDVERQELALERTIKELSQTYRASHPKMMALVKQYEALNKVLKQEVGHAAARLEVIKRALDWEEKRLIEQVEGPASPPSSAPAPDKVPVPKPTNPPKAEVAPSPFAERGEKVAESRLRGAVTNAVAANPSPQPSPLAPQRAREPERPPSAPAGENVRSITPTRNAEPGTRNESQSLVTSAATPVQLAAASPKGITLPVPNPYAKTNSQVPFLTHSSKGAQRINRKLEEIVLPEVHFDAVPLVGVVQRLIEDAKKFDPEKQGLNFLINDVAPAAPLLDAQGNPVPVARPVALSEGLVRVTQPLKNLTLRQALDVICKTAELPTQFSVEEYAIAFIPRGPVAYYSRMFRVSPDAFIQGLQGVVGNPVLGQSVPAAGQAGQAAGGVPATGPVRAVVPATVPATQRTAAEANALVRQFFLSAGVTSLGATNGSTRVTFNPENGLLLVRGTTNDLRLIEQAIQKVQPPVVPVLPAPKPGASAPAPSPFAERGEKVAEGRLRGAAINAVAANPSPQPSPLAAQRAREPERADPLQAAQEEAVRRQERRTVLDASLANAKKLQKEKDFTSAAKLYEECTGHAKLLGGVAAVERQSHEALAGLVHCRIQLAIALQEKHDYKAAAAEADKILPFDPKNAEAEQFKRFNERVEAAHKLKLASPKAPAGADEAKATRARVMGLVRDGQLYYQTGEYSEAKVRLEEAIAKDPLNEAAYFYLRLVQESQFELESKAREKAFGERVVAVTQKWNESARTARPVPNRYYKTNSQVPFLTHSSKGAQRINAKLDEIILPEIQFDNVSLPAVVTWLDGNVKKHDPEKKGLNFLINNVVSDFITLNDAQAGKPAAPVLDPMGNPIASPAAKRARPDLENASVKVTSPIKNLTLRQALDVICKTTVIKPVDGRGQGLKYTVEEYAVVFSPKLPERESLFPRVFKVDPDAFVQGLRSVSSIPDLSNMKGGHSGGWAGPVITNMSTNLNEMVRNYFQAAGVVDLGITNGPDGKGVFFDDRNGRLLVRASLQDLDIIQQAVELLNAKPPQVLIEAKVVEINPNNTKAVGFDWFLGETRFDKSSPTNQPGSANPTGVFPLPALPSGPPALTGVVTNKLVRTNTAPATTITGILTAPQFGAVMRALEQRDAASVRSLPKVTTPSGKQAVLGLPAAAKAEDGFAQGLKLDVLPTVAADGHTLNLAITISRDGKVIVVLQCVVWDGQTVMLGFSEPAAANAQPAAKPLRPVLFLTPSIVDPAGQRVHTDEELPLFPGPVPKPAAPGKQ